MSDFNIEFEENDQQITLEFESGVGGAVSSVNGMTGDVMLDADDVGAYTKPAGGIPKTDLASAVQTSLGKADSAYQKPSSGIPASDMANGVIPAVDNTLTVAGAAADAKKTGDELSSLKEEYTQILDSAYVTDTATGSIASFPDGADGVPVKSLVVEIEPVQSGSGDPSPDNVRPISGHTSAVVTRCNNNLLDYADTTDAYRITSCTDNGDGSFTVVASGAGAYIQHTIPVKAGTTYSIQCESGTVDSGNANQITACTVFDGDTSATKLLNGVSYQSSVSLKSFTPTSNIVTVRCSVTGGNGGGTGTIVKPQVVIGTTIPEYVPYNGQTVTIDLDGTIYGGTLDVTTGVLTVDRERVDLGSLTWGKNKNDQGNDVFSSQGITNAVASSIAVCSAYKNNSETCRPMSLYDGEFSINIKPAITSGYFSSGEIVIKDSSNAETSSADFKTAMSGIYLAYKIKTPTAVQLNPHEVSTLLGVNNVFADTGNVTAEYRADTKLYIEKLTAPTEDDMIADHAISANSFFMVGNSLYRATTAIASGATITVGTNATRLSLSDALNALS